MSYTTYECHTCDVTPALDIPSTMRATSSKAFADMHAKLSGHEITVTKWRDI